MNKTMLVMLLSLSAVVAVQRLGFQQDGADQPGGQPAEQARPSTDDEGAAPESPAEPPGSGDANHADSGAVPPPPGEDGSVAAGVEDSDEIEDDFTPDEEISEDYPVPLPSDI